MSFNHYDAVIVGTGFGGSACALALAEAGMKVLLLERGDWARRNAADWDPHAVLVEKAYQGPSPLQVQQYGGTNFQEMPENETVGGMSVFYGGASLRLRPTDFGDWPVDYGALAPFYDRAEQLLEVHGQAGEDPCEPPGIAAYPFGPIALSPPAERICRAGASLGLRPFRIPTAINFTNPARPVCLQCMTCDGFPCKIEAKNDVTATLLKRAQALGTEIMTGVQVDRVRVDGTCAKAVVCVDRKSKQRFEVPAPVVVLGAGALHSPAILLRSDLSGFAQRDLIGRFLMRHCNAVVTGIFPFRTNPAGVFHKQVCFTDFYEDFRPRDRRAVGVIQDIYTPAPVVLRRYAPTGFKTITGWAAGLMQNLLCVAEDAPLRDNAVRLSNDVDRYGIRRVQVVHQYLQADCARRDYLIKGAKRILRKAGALFFYTYPIDSFSHAVGTARMGCDQQDGVLDADCRFWGLDNLFVVDGSVFPTSGGVNPSLTIAANALRVGAGIVRAFGK